MGVWAVGLYGGDFAADLRSTIAAVARLPFDPDRLAEIISDTEASVSRNPDDPDYTTFWLILADQFAKRGLSAERVRETALAIIDEGRNLAAVRALGMPSADLTRRARVLDDLRSRLRQPIEEKPRDVLKTPQSFLMDVGDMLVYPTESGQPFNPYLSPRRIESIRARHGRAITFSPDGWSACLIVARGRAFEYLTWYQPLTVVHALAELPAIDTVEAVPWWLRSPGTCSKPHFDRMRLHKIAHLSVDAEALSRALGPLRDGRRAAISDVSIANNLSVVPGGKPMESRGMKVRRVETLREVIAAPFT